MLDKGQEDTIEIVRKFELEANHIELDKFDEILYLSNTIRTIDSFVKNKIEVVDGTLQFINDQIEECIKMIDTQPYHKDEKKRLKLNTQLLQEVRRELNKGFLSLRGGIVNGSFVLKNVG